MNLHRAILRVGALLVRIGHADSATLDGDELLAVRTVLRELLTMRDAARRRGLLECQRGQA